MTNLYSVRIESKNSNFCISNKELNRMNLKFIHSENNLILFDVKKLQKKAKKHLKNSRLVIYPQDNRSEFLKYLKIMYPNYSIKQLQEIGFKI